MRVQSEIDVLRTRQKETLLVTCRRMSEKSDFVAESDEFNSGG